MPIQWSTPGFARRLIALAVAGAAAGCLSGCDSTPRRRPAQIHVR
ncbi:putative lipoprotein [Mycobacterium ulcerans str. Harvey]|uniref:Lipoprotein n=1 Tax=Mycobacterium ulcerans str. Harvey TaxID=1299332 RepID=A0ABN0QPT0_MYCUL|nr:putative lipoprotein [Mycobacterium ulcerans str. Harvey]